MKTHTWNRRGRTENVGIKCKTFDRKLEKLPSLNWSSLQKKKKKIKAKLSANEKMNQAMSTF